MIDIDIALTRGTFRLDVAFRSKARLTGLFGRSGVGKSSIIAAMAGLLRPLRGWIRVDDMVLFDAAAAIDLPPHRRRVGLVFQDAQLFPHMSVGGNLRYGQRFAPADPDRRRDGPALLLDRVVGVLGIGALLDRRPASLSGGERQRVAIGRALLSRPRLLLMDEPLASLDMARKLEILALIEQLRDDFGIPILYVSHAVEEIARLAGEVVVIDASGLAHQGRPELVLAAAEASPSEARFRAMSLINARVEAHDRTYGLTTLDHPAGTISVPGRAGAPGSLARILVHGTDVTLATEPPRQVSVRTVLSATVASTTTDDGPVARIDLVLTGGDRLAAFVTRKSMEEMGLAEGRPVYAMIKAASIDEGAGRR